MAVFVEIFMSMRNFFVGISRNCRYFGESDAEITLFLEYSVRFLIEYSISVFSFSLLFYLFLSGGAPGRGGGRRGGRHLVGSGSGPEATRSRSPGDDARRRQWRQRVGEVKCCGFRLPRAVLPRVHVLARRETTNGRLGVPVDLGLLDGRPIFP